MNQIVGRLRGQLVFAGGAAPLWITYMVAMGGYAALRGVGADLITWHNGWALESAVFGGVPTRFLQEHIYVRDVVWLDFAGFVLHLSWFFIPFVFGLIISLFERRRLLEYLTWIVVASYASDIFYILFPLTPPWMHEGVHRVLTERSFIHYTGLDNNPVAAFPSFHAALPLVIGLFFLLRAQRTRACGYVACIWALFIGFAVVYLGEHWVIDVLGGYGLALGVALVCTNAHLKRGLRRVPVDPFGKVIAADVRLQGYGTPFVPDPIERETEADFPDALPRAA